VQSFDPGPSGISAIDGRAFLHTRSKDEFEEITNLDEVYARSVRK
jgi:hypothetical protein